ILRLARSRASAWFQKSGAGRLARSYGNSDARPSGLDLGAIHEAPRVRVERVAPVQRAAVVPDQHGAHLPLLAKSELRLRRVRPQFVEQRFALGEREAQDVAVAPPPQEQALAAGLGVRAHEGVMRARRPPRIGELLIPLAHDTGAVVG